MILKIREIKSKEVIKYIEWQKVPNYNFSAKKGVKVSGTVKCHLNMQNFLKILTTELQLLKDHLNRVSAFKEARTEADDFQNVSALQIDWLKNPKLRQSEE